MENTKKFNRLSIVSIILILVGPSILVLYKLNIYLPKGEYWVINVILISLILGFVLAIISLFKIKKSGEKGRVLSILALTMFILLVLFSIISSTFQGEPTRGKNSALKAQLANIGAQSEYYQSSKGSFDGLCDAPHLENGLGGVRGPGLLKEAIDYSMKNTTKCFSDKNSWVVTSGLPVVTEQGTHFCVDSTGTIKTINSSQNDLIINSDTLCSGDSRPN